jgi:hypothetical protein
MCCLVMANTMHHGAKISVDELWNDGKQGKTEEPQCHFVYHKSALKPSSGFERGPPS